ncbi:MAG TPA: hypothetical protein DEA96_15530, partial [Leptospiraceae bacterium]|nr:hypothetical protein [Leptospiraceae bacterium]
MSAANRLRISVVTETHLPELNGVSRSLDRMITGIRDKGHEINVFRPAQKSDSVSKMNLALDSITGLSLTDLSGLSKDQDSREVKGPEYARAESNRAQPEPETLT